MRRSVGAEIILVDDGSTDGSAAYLKQHFPKVKLVEKATNSGFSTTVNLGAKAATGEILVLLNTDAVPQVGYLKALTKHFEDPEVFAVGCLDKSLDGDRIVERGRGIGSFRRGFLVHARGEVNKTTTLWASGGSSAYRMGLWEKLGGLDEMYDPFYWEDIDLSYRAAKSGFKVLFEPEAIVEHRHGEGSIKYHYSSARVNAIAYRNQFMFTWKMVTDKRLLLTHVFWLPYHFLNSLLRFDFAFWQGFATAFVRLPQIIRYRRHHTYPIADLEVTAQFENES
jgi:GT2 family glycosyltransferase